MEARIQKESGAGEGILSIKRWNARRDANEIQIVKALRKAGASVARISEPGMPDLIVWYRGSVFLLEIKMPLGRATKAQEARRVEGWPVVTARTEEAALRAVGALR